MKRLPVFAALLCLVCLPGNVLAWEFSLRGENIIRYRFWTRVGNNNIFGRMDTNLNLGVNHLKTHPSPNRDNLPGPSFGVLAGENRFGADMNFSDLQVTLYTKTKINPAITMESSINLTSLGLHSGGRPLGNWEIPGEVNQLAVPVSNRPSAINVPNTMSPCSGGK